MPSILVERPEKGDRLPLIFGTRVCWGAFNSTWIKVSHAIIIHIAGQERFQSVHPSYYMGAHCCILTFDVTRKITYKNLETWYAELVAHRGKSIPIIVAANKMDMDISKARKTFGFVERKREERANGPDDMPLYFVSASNGTNVVAMFQEAIKRAWDFKESGAGTFADEILQFIQEEEARVDGIFSPTKDKAPAFPPVHTRQLSSNTNDDGPVPHGA
jgi:GTPase SAR1 family protein